MRRQSGINTSRVSKERYKEAKIASVVGTHFIQIPSLVKSKLPQYSLLTGQCCGRMTGERSGRSEIGKGKEGKGKRRPGSKCSWDS